MDSAGDRSGGEGELDKHGKGKAEEMLMKIIKSETVNIKANVVTSTIKVLVEQLQHY